MAVFNQTNSGTSNGAVGADTLNYTINTTGGTTGVLLTGITGSLATGYAGTFDGPGTSNGIFTGIENFGFVDTAGGNDTLNFGDGADSINSGAGDDIINAAGGNDTVNAGTGNDTINTGLGIDSINAGDGDDTITVTFENANTVDTVDGGLGTDTLIWTGGTQAVSLSASAIVTASQGAVSFTGIERFNITGSSADDIMTSGANNDTLNGGSGADALNGGAGNDSVNGGAGNDTITTDVGSNDTIDGGADTDKLIVLGAGAAFTLTTTSIASGSGVTTLSNIENFDVSGSTASDSITTGAGNDSITGGSGNDTINAGGGTNVINGGAGDDRITVTTLSGTDVIDGGTETDTLVIVGSASSLSLNMVGTGGTFAGPATQTFTNIEQVDVTASSANDNLLSGDGDDTLNGLGGNDTLNAGAGNNRVDGDTGDDSIAALGGNDLIFGGVGLDVINAGNGANTVYGGDDADSITTGTGNDYVEGGAGVDTIIVGNGTNQVLGGDGNDVITSGTGVDTIYGGNDDDNINSGSGFDRIYGGAGVDYLTLDLSAATVGINISLSNEAGNGVNNSTFGTGGIVQGIEGMNVITGSGNDTIRGYFNDLNSITTNDSFSTGGGNDAIRVYLSGTDVVNAGSGTDAVVIYAEDGVALTTTGNVVSGTTFSAVYGDGTNQVTVTNAENMFVFGSSQDDLIITGNGGDAVYGGAGNDVLRTGKGKEFVNGGTGLDMWVLNTSASTAGASININRPADQQGIYQVSGKFLNIEGINITGGNSGDTITTHATFQMDDVLNLAGGFDKANIALRGDDVVNLGAGIDTLVVNAILAGDGANVSLGAFTDGAGYAGSASQGTDSIVFTGVDYLSFNGSNSNDTASGGSGIDRLYGNGGDDILSASSNADRLFGGAGADTLTGGSGNDQMTGGADADVFVFSKTTYAGTDKIFDFEDGVDKILISGGTNANIKSITSIGGGDDTLITLANNTTITLLNVESNDITKGGDFIFA